ncbi:MAG TPA: inosine/xanthosine triphosphatase [Candidatus Saccharimonadales bacterium]|nr:inosine/xanthosine triphosphatase [Candidatus Saccharimonadales bacterium]
MKVVVGSKNGPKRRSVEAAFTGIFPGEELQIIGVDADSGVSSHPITAEESLQGAMNRAAEACRQEPQADFYVGIEGGLLTVADRTWELSWVAIQDKNGKVFTGVSAGLEVRGKALAAIRGGQELSDVLDSHHGVKNAGQKNGFYGLATNDFITREQACRDAVAFALAPFKNAKYFK